MIVAMEEYKKMARIGKAMRILSMQLELLRGGKIYKKSYCKKNEISARTFERDISDISLSLSESFSGQEVKYVNDGDYYHLEKPDMIKPLTAIEASFLLEMIKTCQVLQREEYTGMVDSIVRATELNRRQSLEKMAEKYKTLEIGASEDALLKMLWDLLQCVVEQDRIRIHFKDKRKVELAPVFLWMYKDKIYLFAYEEKILKVYSLQDIDWFTLLGSKYPRELQEKFYKMPREQIHKRIENMEKSEEE